MAAQTAASLYLVLCTEGLPLLELPSRKAILRFEANNSVLAGAATQIRADRHRFSGRPGQNPLATLSPPYEPRSYPSQKENNPGMDCPTESHENIPKNKQNA